MSAPDFAQDLKSVRQLATKQDAVLRKHYCYLQGQTAAPLDAQIIGIRGSDNLYRTAANLNEKSLDDFRKKKEKCQAVPAVVPVIKEDILYATMNHRSNTTIEMFAKEYPDAFEFLKSKKYPTASCPECVEAHAKIKVSKEAPLNKYASVDTISSDTTGPISTADMCGNKYLQLYISGCSNRMDNGSTEGEEIGGTRSYTESLGTPSIVM